MLNHSLQLINVRLCLYYILSFSFMFPFLNSSGHPMWVSISIVICKGIQRGRTFQVVGFDPLAFQMEGDFCSSYPEVFPLSSALYMDRIIEFLLFGMPVDQTCLLPTTLCHVFIILINFLVMVIRCSRETAYDFQSRSIKKWEERYLILSSHYEIIGPFFKSVILLNLHSNNICSPFLG